MDNNDDNRGKDALVGSISWLKGLEKLNPNFKLIGYIIAFLSAGGGSMFLYVWDKAQDEILKVATPQILHLADSISKAKITYVLDSINYKNKNRGSFRNDLSVEIGTTRDSVAGKIGDFYKGELGLYYIGLFYDPIRNKIMYKHTNGEEYRVVYRREKDYYYYFDDNGLFKKVK